MSFEVKGHAARTTDFSVSIKTSSGGYIQLANDDVVRVKLGRSGTVALDLDSVAATANGSRVTIDETGDGSATHNSSTVRLAQGDTEDLAGAYDCEVLLVDNSETAPADAIKAAEYGIVHIIRSLDGDVGLT